MEIGILWVTIHQFFVKDGKKFGDFIHTQRGHILMKSPNDDVGFLVTKSREFASGIDINV
jgi:catalase